MAKPNRKILTFLILVKSFLLAISQQPTPQPQQRSSGYLDFVFNATDFPSQDDYYDYIVVGGGTAGCPLAATLSSTYRVLLLERGGTPDASPNLSTEDGFLSALMDTTVSSPSQAFTSEDGIPNARGRVLGGSSAINAGFYSRADPEFFRVSGIDFSDVQAVNDSFNWVEDRIVFKPELRDWQTAVRDGFLDAGIGPYNGYTLEHLFGTKIGGSTFDPSGKRRSSADLLAEAVHANIRVAVYATVERVLIAPYSSEMVLSSAAIGVVYRDANRKYHHAMVREGGEVILSAGAIGTPQLLLLSGIGSRPYLSSWGIPVAHHLPFVGQFLYDNPRNGISIIPSSPLEHSLIQVVGITNSGTYLEASSNVIPFASPSRHIFIGELATPIYVTVATLMEKIVGPLSAGSLRLASTDVRISPIVRFNYLSNPVDMERCVGGMRRIAEVLKSRALDDLKFREWFGGGNFRFVGPELPTDLEDGALMADFCRDTVNTIWHYHGGCVVGKVVDGDLKVIGIDSLRVIDGSTFVISPGTNPQATLMMLGRYFGLKIIKDRARAGNAS